MDRNGLTVLSREESLALLGSRSVGRIAVTMRALPTILPVTDVLDATTESIVFRTGYGTKLDAAGRNAVVAFEIDDLDEATRTGWSVVAIGTASEVTDPTSSPASPGCHSCRGSRRPGWATPSPSRSSTWRGDVSRPDRGSRRPGSPLSDAGGQVTQRRLRSRPRLVTGSPPRGPVAKGLTDPRPRPGVRWLTRDSVLEGAR